MRTIRSLTIAAILTLPMSAVSFQTANAAECSASFSPGYVRMANSGIHRNNWRGKNFIRLNNWNDVVSLYGISVKKAQGQTCGCTQYKGTPPKHKNSVCQRALDSGLR